MLSPGGELAGYRAVRDAVGVAERPDLVQLRMWGRNPVKMLHGLITNDLEKAPEGQGVYAAMLTPKGRMIAELRAFVRRRADGVEVLIDLPRAALEGTREHLRKFVPPMFAKWEEAATGAVGVYGPGARALLQSTLEVEIPELAEDGFLEVDRGGEPLLLARTGYAGGEEGYDLFAPAATLPALRDALLARGEGTGARAVGADALEVLRVEAGRPRYGRELTEETIPTEAFEAIGQMPRAVSFTKGCYTGQEVIVRIAHRGHVNRHLRGLLLGDSPLPAPRTPLHHVTTGKEIGWTTSAAVSPLRGETVALGFVRRELAPGDEVRLGSADGQEVRVVSLPFERRNGDGES